MKNVFCLSWKLWSNLVPILEMYEFSSQNVTMLKMHLQMSIKFIYFNELHWNFFQKLFFFLHVSTPRFPFSIAIDHLFLSPRHNHHNSIFTQHSGYDLAPSFIHYTLSALHSNNFHRTKYHKRKTLWGRRNNIGPMEAGVHTREEEKNPLGFSILWEDEPLWISFFQNLFLLNSFKKKLIDMWIMRCPNII